MISPALLAQLQNLTQAQSSDDSKSGGTAVATQPPDKAGQIPTDANSVANILHAVLGLPAPNLAPPPAAPSNALPAAVTPQGAAPSNASPSSVNSAALTPQNAAALNPATAQQKQPPVNALPPVQPYDLNRELGVPPQSTQTYSPFQAAQAISAAPQAQVGGTPAPVDNTATAPTQPALPTSDPTNPYIALLNNIPKPVHIPQKDAPPQAPDKVQIGGQQVDLNNKQDVDQHVFNLLDQAAKMRDAAAQLSPGAIRSLTLPEAGMAVLASLFDPTHEAGTKFMNEFSAAQQQMQQGKQAKYDQQTKALAGQADSIEKQANVLNDRYGDLTKADLENRAQIAKANDVADQQNSKMDEDYGNNVAKVTDAGIAAQNALEKQRIINQGKIDVQKATIAARQPYLDATAKWRNALADTQIATRAAEVKKLTTQSDLNLARASYQKDLSDRAAAMAAYTRMKTTWYPKQLESEISKNNASAEKLFSDAQLAQQKLANAIAHPDGQVSANVLFLARLATQRAMDKAASTRDKYAEERNTLTSRLAALNKGAAESYTGEKIDIAKQLNANAGLQSYWHEMYDRAYNMIGTIEDSAVPKTKTNPDGTKISQAGILDNNGIPLDINHQRQIAADRYNSYLDQNLPAAAKAIEDAFEKAYGQPLDPSKAK